MALHGTLDAIAMLEMPQSREPEFTQSKIKARVQMGAVDRVSEHQTNKIKSRFRGSWGNTWTHQEFLMWIERRDMDHAIVGSWDHCS